MTAILDSLFVFIFCALTCVGIYKFAHNRERLLEYWISFQQDWLSQREHRHRIQFEVTQSTPMIDAAVSVQCQVDQFLDAQDYLQLADFIIDLDQQRAKCPSQKSLALTALIHFADRTHINGNVGVETDDSFAARIEHLSVIHPRRYVLVAMTSLLRIREAWAARGEGFANSVSKKDWEIIEKRIQKAEWLLSHTDAAALNSPLIAFCKFELLAFAEDADKTLMPTYEVWSELDPACQTAHEQVGLKLLPRWYGDLPTLERQARRAAVRTREVSGMAAYYTMLSEAIGCDPIHLVIDPELFVQGVNDLLDLRANDPATVGIVFHDIEALAAWAVPPQAPPTHAETWHTLNQKLTALMDDIIATRLHRIHPPSWDGGTNTVLNLITRRFRTEMDAGFHFVMGSAGIEVIEEPTDEQMAQA